MDSGKAEPTTSGPAAPFMTVGTPEDILQLANALIEESFDAMLVLDADGMYVGANRSWGTVFQMDREAILGQHFTKALAPSDAHLSSSFFEQIVKTGHLEFVHEFTLSTGAVRLFEVRGRKLGELFLFALRDLTHERPLRRLPQDAAMDTGTMLENLSEMVCAFLPGGAIQYVNTAYCDYFGVQQAEIIGSTYVPIVVPDDLPRIEAALATLSPQSPNVQIENRVYRSDGAVRWTQWINRAFYNEAGELVELLSTGRDIHEKRLSQEELEVSEERFRLAARATRDYIWDWDLLRDELFFGEGLRLIAPSGWPGPKEAFPWWEEQIHPDDRERVVAGLLAVVEHELDSYWTDSYRFRREDGSWADIVDRGYILRTERGTPLRMVGSMLDLSEHRRIQERLEQTQEKLQIMMRASQEGLWEYDFRTDTVIRNHAVWDLLGLPRTDEPTPSDLWVDMTHPEDIPLLFSSWSEAITQRLPSWACEYRLRHQDGHYLNILDRGFFTYSPEGEPVRAFGSITDQTERYRQEAELRKRETTLALAQSIAHLGSWELELGVEPHYWSDEMFRIMGYEPGSVEPDMALFWRLAHPDDHVLINSEIDAALSSRRPYNVTHRIVRPDGRLRWVNQQCQIERDADGTPRFLRGTCLDVTERVLAESEIREREERFRSMADSSPALIYLEHAAGGRNYLNTRWEDSLGLSTADLLGDGWLDRVHPADRPALEGRHATLSERPEASQLDYRVLFADGTWHWLLDTATPRYAADGTFLGFIGSCLDITPRKIAEELQKFLADTGVLLTSALDIDSSLVRIAQYCVPLLCDLCVVNFRDEHSGEIRRLALAHTDFEIHQALQGFLPPEPVDLLVSGGLEWVSRNQRVLMVEDAQHPDPALGVKPVAPELSVVSRVQSGFIVPLILRGQMLGSLSFLSQAGRERVLPELRETAEEIARRIALAVDNARLYRALQIADQRKDLFLATLAHELRNPAAAILSAAQLLRLPETDPETQAWGIQLMERQGLHISRLLDDLLDVSRITRGKIQLRHQPLDFREVIQFAVQSTSIVLDERQHTLIVELPGEPVMLVGDPTRIEQIVSNLLNNAAKYTGSGGRIEIRLTIDETEREAVLTVSDNGIGIEPQLLPQLFEMFIQAERALERSQGGLGIGLTLVRMLVELHGGVVSASSEGPGTGSRFEVRLPMPLELPTGESLSAETHSPSSRQLRILVVDDNHDVAQALTRLIAARGHHVTAINESTAALGVIEGTSPDLVILDIGMPGMDGYTLARLLADHPLRRRFLLVALTGFGQEEDARLAVEAGFDHHRTKPLDRRELTRVLDLALLHRMGLSE